jgi:uncharacterized protein
MGPTVRTFRGMDPLLSLADERFISLTTFRRSGAAVSTPVWVGRDGDALVVLTPSGSGKVRRLRRNPRVEVQPCGRFGGVEEGSAPVSGTAEIREQKSDVDRARATIRRTYPIESRIVLGIERTVERLRRKPPTPRLALHLTADPG